MKKEDKCKCGRGFTNKFGVVTRYGTKKGWVCENCQNEWVK